MFTVECKRCGYKFYRGVKLPNLYRIYMQYGGKCPRCGREIGWVPLTIEVKPRRGGATE